MIILMISLYRFRTEERKREITESIETNLANQFIDKVVIFWENVDSAYIETFPFKDSNKLVNIHVKERPTYKVMFDYANTEYPHNFIMVANSDIVFDHQIQYFYGRDWNNTFWCLTRWNNENGEWRLQGDGLNGSSDAWIFESPLPDFNADIHMGVIGCDSYLAQKAIQANLRLLNPCHWLKIKHRHTIGERNDAPNGISYWQKSDYEGFCVYPSEPNA